MPKSARGENRADFHENGELENGAGQPPSGSHGVCQRACMRDTHGSTPRMPRPRADEWCSRAQRMCLCACAHEMHVCARNARMCACAPRAHEMHVCARNARMCACAHVRAFVRMRACVVGGDCIWAHAPIVTRLNMLGAMAMSSSASLPFTGPVKRTSGSRRYAAVATGDHLACENRVYGGFQAPFSSCPSPTGCS